MSDIYIEDVFLYDVGYHIRRRLQSYSITTITLNHLDASGKKLGL